MTHLLKEFETYDSLEEAITADILGLRYSRGKTGDARPRLLCVYGSLDVCTFLREILCNAGFNALTTTTVEDAPILLKATKAKLVAPAQPTSFSRRTYGKADGLPTRECSIGSQPAACRTDRPVVVSHDQGPGVGESRGTQPISGAVVMIESVLVDDHEQRTNHLNSAWSQSVVMPAGAEQLEIHYTGLHFSAPDGPFQAVEGHENRAKASDSGSQAIPNCRRAITVSM